VSENVSRNVVEFLNMHVDHVVKLELLLAVHAAPSATTTIPTAARLLDISRGQVRAMADELAEEGVLRVSSDRIELAPASVEVRLAVSDLASIYHRDRQGVLDVLKALGRAS
jgi:DNA-binding IclR family transcriptional regulator